MEGVVPECFLLRADDAGCGTTCLPMQLNLCGSAEKSPKAGHVPLLTANGLPPAGEEHSMGV